MSEAEATGTTPMNNETAPANTNEAAPGGSGGTTKNVTDSSPTWDGEFDPERASRLVANLREENKATKKALAEVNAKLAEYEQAKMSDLEKLTLRAETAEKELAEKKRALLVVESARKHNLSDDLMQFITGDTPEEVDKQAQLLAEKLSFAATSTKTEAPTKPRMKPVSGNGADNDSAGQLTQDDLRSMSPVEIAKARKDGRLNNLLGIKP